MLSFSLSASVTLNVSAAPLTAVAVGTETQLINSFSDGSAEEIQLTADITMTKNLTLSHNIVIYGGIENHTINLGANKLNAGGNDITLAENLTITAQDSRTGSTITGTGSFIIDADADVIITRYLGTYNTNLIDGFRHYIFRENCKFSAQAGTNRTESNKGLLQTAVIRSFPAESFVVAQNAIVKLISDYSGSDTTHGSTALILRKPKGGQLNVDVQEDAELHVIAYGTGLNTRDRAPVLILHEALSGDTGVSNTTIKGKLNVTSNNGNGWYYQYIDYVTTTSDYFIVDGGEVNIYALNGVTKSHMEYAAFESYGRNPTYITVQNGGVMNIVSNGYRGMSLAAGGSYAEKSITVKGPGSKLYVYGYMWAIAAETQPTLNISAIEGGEIVLESCVDKLGNVVFPGSTVYSVGPTTYTVDGVGSKLAIMHYGGSYGAIFADGYGKLSINVIRGGNMYVYSKNSGSDTPAHRAAICAQSGLDYIHWINVDGAGSTLEVINDNTAACNDTSLYPRSAIAFAANTSGDIFVSNGGHLFATNNNAQSPTIALGGYGTNTTNGRLSVYNPGEVDIKNNAATINPYAVALRSTNYLQSASGNSRTSLDLRGSEITVWPIGKGTAWLASDIVDTWSFSFFTAQNNNKVSTMPKVGQKGSTSFKLSDYGRLYIRGNLNCDIH
jgi:hypothetical protein